jgi:hypothetical protein
MIPNSNLQWIQAGHQIYVIETRDWLGFHHSSGTSISPPQALHDKLHVRANNKCPNWQPIFKMKIQWIRFMSNKTIWVQKNENISLHLRHILTIEEIVGRTMSTNGSKESPQTYALIHGNMMIIHRVLGMIHNHLKRRRENSRKMRSNWTIGNKRR